MNLEGTPEGVAGGVAEGGGGSDVLKSDGGAGEVIGGPGGEETEEKADTDTKDMMHWEKVVALVRAAFGEGKLVEEFIWKAVILIPKRTGDYHGIGLV